MFMEVDGTKSAGKGGIVPQSLLQWFGGGERGGGGGGGGME